MEGNSSNNEGKDEDEGGEKVNSQESAVDDDGTEFANKSEKDEAKEKFIKKPVRKDCEEAAGIKVQENVGKDEVTNLNEETVFKIKESTNKKVKENGKKEVNSTVNKQKDEIERPVNKENKMDNNDVGNVETKENDSEGGTSVETPAQESDIKDSTGNKIINFVKAEGGIGKCKEVGGKENIEDKHTTEVSEEGMFNCTTVKADVEKIMDGKESKGKNYSPAICKTKNEVIEENSMQSPVQVSSPQEINMQPPSAHEAILILEGSSCKYSGTGYGPELQDGQSTEGPSNYEFQTTIELCNNQCKQESELSKINEQTNIKILEEQQIEEQKCDIVSTEERNLNEIGNNITSDNVNMKMKVGSQEMNQHAKEETRIEGNESVQQEKVKKSEKCLEYENGHTNVTVGTENQELLSMNYTVIEEQHENTNDQENLISAISEGNKEEEEVAQEMENKTNEKEISSCNETINSSINSNILIKEEVICNENAAGSSDVTSKNKVDSNMQKIYSEEANKTIKMPEVSELERLGKHEQKIDECAAKNTSHKTNTGTSNKSDLQSSVKKEEQSEEMKKIQQKQCDAQPSTSQELPIKSEEECKAMSTETQTLIKTLPKIDDENFQTQEIQNSLSTGTNVEKPVYTVFQETVSEGAKCEGSLQRSRLTNLGENLDLLKMKSDTTALTEAAINEQFKQLELNVQQPLQEQPIVAKQEQQKHSIQQKQQLQKQTQQKQQRSPTRQKQQAQLKQQEQKQPTKSPTRQKQLTQTKQQDQRQLQKHQPLKSPTRQKQLETKITSKQGQQKQQPPIKSPTQKKKTDQNQIQQRQQVMKSTTLQKKTEQTQPQQPVKSPVQQKKTEQTQQQLKQQQMPRSLTQKNQQKEQKKQQIPSQQRQPIQKTQQEQKQPIQKTQQEQKQPIQKTQQEQKQPIQKTQQVQKQVVQKRQAKSEEMERKQKNEGQLQQELFEHKEVHSDHKDREQNRQLQKGKDNQQKKLECMKSKQNQDSQNQQLQQQEKNKVQHAEPIKMEKQRESMEHIKKGQEETKQLKLLNGQKDIKDKENQPEQEQQKQPNQQQNNLRTDKQEQPKQQHKEELPNQQQQQQQQQQQEYAKQQQQQQSEEVDESGPGCGGLQGRSCPIYFGVKSYLHQFYDSAPVKNSQLYEEYIEEDDFEYAVDPVKSRGCRRCCRGFWFRAGLWGGINLILVGVITLLIGYFTPQREMVVGHHNNLEILDRSAIAFNRRLELCRLAGLAVFCCGGLVLLLTLLFSTFLHIRGHNNNGPCCGENAYYGYVTTSLVEPFIAGQVQDTSLPIPTGIKIPITEQIKSVQPTLWPDIAAVKDGALMPHMP